uniref:angiopoietin-like protein 8 isoform X2 n=1 Tax=Doryrhamphus excisus TaxID=161450 RepID=UPI0025AEBE63|nr:angiopoietin-like protein 8 isoform X2 [Doryrhamphus excisus]
MIWCLCLLYVAVGFGPVHAASIKRPGRTEDVNVLMYGVIQFGESLNYVLETTEAKMAEIGRTLKGHEGALRRLGEQMRQAAEVKEQIKGVIELLLDQMSKQQAHTKITEGQLARMEQEEVALGTKVKSLESYLNNMFPTSIKDLQERAALNGNILKGLQHLTQFQKEKIESQNEQISTLQRMSEAL